VATKDHEPTCACGGSGVIRGHAVNARGDRYTVWSRCPNTGPTFQLDPGPVVGLSEYLARHPTWPADLPFTDDDDEWCRRAARALAHDPGGVELRADNPLAARVARYVLEYREE
jgi:hypothetical protein